MKKRKFKARSNHSEASDEQALSFLGRMTAVYVLDAAGHIQPEEMAVIKARITNSDPNWNAGIEEIYGINRTFVRSVYALCTELWEPLTAITFILRGIGSPKVEESLRDLANEFCD